MSTMGDKILLLLPVVLGGIINMIFIKSDILKKIYVPIDGGKLLSDGHPLFGQNKTVKGFFGMIFFTGLSTTGLFLLFPKAYIGIDSTFVTSSLASVLVSFFNGGILGFFYVLFELPNSFIKRRLGIMPGTNKSGSSWIKYLFIFIDQADSVLGCALALMFFYTTSIEDFIVLIVLGIITHYIINILLYLLKLKNQAG